MVEDKMKCPYCKSKLFEIFSNKKESMGFMCTCNKCKLSGVLLPNSTWQHLIGNSFNSINENLKKKNDSLDKKINKLNDLLNKACEALSFYANCEHIRIGKIAENSLNFKTISGENAYIEFGKKALSTLADIRDNKEKKD